MGVGFPSSTQPTRLIRAFTVMCVMGVIPLIRVRRAIFNSPQKSVMNKCRLGCATAKPNKTKVYICISFYPKGLWVLGFMLQPNLRGDRSPRSAIDRTILSLKFSSDSMSKASSRSDRTPKITVRRRFFYSSSANLGLVRYFVYAPYKIRCTHLFLSLFQRDPSITQETDNLFLCGSRFLVVLRRPVLVDCHSTAPLVL